MQPGDTTGDTTGDTNSALFWLGADCVALFVRRLRRGRLGEFLEARIIPERIEHGIELEQRGSERRNLSEKFSLLFRREGGDDFLEARIAAQRVPERQQF